MAPSPMNMIHTYCLFPSADIYTPSFTAIQPPDFHIQNHKTPPAHLPRARKSLKQNLATHPCRSPAVPRYLTGPLLYTPKLIPRIHRKPVPIQLRPIPIHAGIQHPTDIHIIITTPPLRRHDRHPVHTLRERRPEELSRRRSQCALPVIQVRRHLR